MDNHKHNIIHNTLNQSINNNDNRILRNARLPESFDATFGVSEMSTNGHSDCLLLRASLLCAELCQTQTSAYIVSAIEAAEAADVVV